MNTSNFEWPVDKKPLYSLLSIRLRGLIDGIPHQISNLANASALLGDALLNINWVGFYLMREGRLVLGPFQGKPACIEIEIGKGVCGTAVANDQVMLVKDVHQFPGHIACDSASNSEIVIPLHKGTEIVGVLDIDSPVLARFDEEDQEGLEHFVRILESIFDRSGRHYCVYAALKSSNVSETSLSISSGCSCHSNRFTDRVCLISSSNFVSRSR